MRRRDLFKRIGVLAAAAAVAPAVGTAEATEQLKSEILLDEVLANPDTYPDLWAQARRYQAEQPSPDAHPFRVDGNSMFAGTCAVSFAPISISGTRYSLPLDDEA